MSSFLFFSGFGDHPDMHSFPTRRSSDLHRLLRIGEPQLALVEALDGFAQGEVAVRGRVVGLAVAKPSSASDRKSTRLNSSHQIISYAVFCLKKKTNKKTTSTVSHRTRTE